MVCRTGKLKDLQKRYSCVGDVRGSGLFLGVNLIKAGGMELDTALAQEIKNELRNRLILISTDGPYDSAIKTKLPLIFTRENAEEVVGQLANILERNC